jgi:hypothetical protein
LSSVVNGTVEARDVADRARCGSVGLLSNTCSTKDVVVNLHPDDIDSPEAAERIRRSVAMLRSGQPAFDREDALLVLNVLIRYLRSATGQ